MATYVVNPDALAVIPPVPEHAGFQQFRGNGLNNSVWFQAFGDGNECTINVIAYMGGRIGSNGIPTQTKAGSNVYFSGMGCDQNGDEVFFGSVGWQATENATTGQHGAEFYINYIRTGTGAFDRFLEIDDGELSLHVDKIVLQLDGEGEALGLDTDVSLPDGTLLRYRRGLLVLKVPPA